MKILVCIKRVPAPGAKILVTEDGQSVDDGHLGHTTSPHEECGLEAGVQLVEEHGGDVTVLTLGPEIAEEQLRYAASCGATAMVLVKADSLAWDPQRTATEITAAIQQLEADRGEFDLILFGNESADTGGFQVGIRAAHALGRPMVNGIKGIDVDGPNITARREVDGGFEVYEMSAPAVLGTKEGINLPRYPTMKGRLASKKLELQVIDAGGEDGGQARVQLKRPVESVSETVILGTGPEAAPAIVDLLEELGVM
jgi:electron transfer flavoprotein beta subunit